MNRDSPKVINLFRSSRAFQWKCMCHSKDMVKEIETQEVSKRKRNSFMIFFSDVIIYGYRSLWGGWHQSKVRRTVLDRCPCRSIPGMQLCCLQQGCNSGRLCDRTSLIYLFCVVRIWQNWCHFDSDGLNRGTGEQDREQRDEKTSQITLFQTRTQSHVFTVFGLNDIQWYFCGKLLSHSRKR